MADERAGTPRVRKPAAKPAVKAVAAQPRPRVKVAAKPVEPVRKVAPAKPAARKAAAKPGRPAAAAKPPAKSAPRARRAVEPVAEVLGDAEERHPDEPVVPLPPVPPTVLDELFEPAPDGRRPLPLRVLRGDWRPALLAALPALVVTVVLAALAATVVLTATEPEGDDLVVGDTTAGRWLRYVCVAVGLTFGAPLRARSEGESVFFGDEVGLLFAPLTVTFLALGALALGARRAAARDRTEDRVAGAIRTAAVYAAGIAAVTAFGRWSLVDRDEFFPGGPVRERSWTFAASPWRALFWAFVAAYAVTWLVTGPVRLGDRVAEWLLPLRGALVGLGTGLALTFVALVVIAYVHVDRVDGQASDVTGALPGLAGYGVGLAAVAFGVFAGGSFAVPLSGRGESFHLWSGPVPDAYVLLLLVPAVAVVAGVVSVLRRGTSPAEAVRACARMALPAAGLWWLLAVAGGARMEGMTYGLFGGSDVGANPWHALLVGLWFGAGGWLVARAVAHRRTPAAFDPPEGAPVP